MADGERIVLDPAEVANGRVEFDLTPFVGPAGPDWGDAGVVNYMAEQQLGEIPVDYRIPSRQPAIPLVLLDRTDITFDEARSQIQALAGVFQAEGGWIKREIVRGATTKKFYADVTSATLKLGGSTAAAFGWSDADAVLTLECLPDWYGDEEELALHVGADGQCILLEEDIAGSFPRGNRCRIVVTGDADNDQLGIKYGIRSRHYSAEPTAALSYEAEELDPLDLATVQTFGFPTFPVSGGASNNVVRHNNLSTAWTSILGLQLASGAHLTHTGTYRLEARVFTSALTLPIDVRCVYGVGDMANVVENAPRPVRGRANFHLVDLGEVRLDPTAMGDHRWLGQIQARGPVGGEDIHIDRVRLWPVAESYAKIASSLLPTSEGLADYLARDEFNHASGNLTGKTAPVGGIWAGGGDADDFTLNTFTKSAQRTAISDAPGFAGPRRVWLSTPTLAATAAHVDLSTTALVASGGLLFRYVDASNYGLVAVDQANREVVVWAVVAGNAFNVCEAATPPLVVSTWYSLRIAVTTSGMVLVWLWPSGSRADSALAIGQRSELAAGGALDDGKVGIWDQNFTATAATREFKNFKAWAPRLDTAIIAGRSAELCTDGSFRATADGVGSDRLVPHGSHPRLPQSGAEGRTAEVMVATTRGDFDQVPDFALDDVSVQIHYRPSWLTTPNA